MAPCPLYRGHQGLVVAKWNMVNLNILIFYPVKLCNCCEAKHVATIYLLEHIKFHKASFCVHDTQLLTAPEWTLSNYWMLYKIWHHKRVLKPGLPRQNYLRPCLQGQADRTFISSTSSTSSCTFLSWCAENVLKPITYNVVIETCLLLFHKCGLGSSGITRHL